MMKFVRCGGDVVGRVFPLSLKLSHGWRFGIVFFGAQFFIGRFLIMGDWPHRENNQRKADWDRLSALAGLTPEGHVAPPDTGGGIDRHSALWWRNSQFKPDGR